MEKIPLKLTGDLCLDDSDRELIMLWNRAVNIEGESFLVCWQVTNPKASALTDMTDDWTKFVVLTPEGKPLGTARDYLLTK